MIRLISMHCTLTWLWLGQIIMQSYSACTCWPWVGQSYFTLSMHLRGCSYCVFPHSLINSYEHFASSIMPNPTLLAALGAMPPPSLLALVPLTQHQPSTPPTFQLPQSSYGNGLILSPLPSHKKLLTRFDPVNLLRCENCWPTTSHYWSNSIESTP